MVGCSAVIFDKDRAKILLTRRSDNGRWCLPGGQMEAGETVEEACVREVQEETGLEVVAGHLIGVYSSPDQVIEYTDGNRYHIVGLCFECQIRSGVLGLSDETTEVGYFSLAEIEQLDLMEHHRERLTDAYGGQYTTLVK